jgi:hypothetical protein
MSIIWWTLHKASRIWYSADSTYPGIVIPFSQRYLISWVNSYHRWAAALTPPRVWITWHITTANLHMSPSTAADFNPDDKPCSHNAFVIMKITCSLLGWDAMKISNLTFTITFNPLNQHKHWTILSVSTVKLIPGHLAMVKFVVRAWTFPLFYSLGTGNSFHGAKCPKHEDQLTSIYSWGEESMELYLHSFRYLHSTVLMNYTPSASFIFT